MALQRESILTKMNTLPEVDELWDFSDPEGTESRFRAALESAEDESLAAEIQTQIARTYSLRRMFDDCHDVLDGVAAVLPRVANRVEVRYLLERGRAWNSAGDKSKAKGLFLSAFDAAKRSNDDHLTVDAAHMLAIVESGGAALEWNLLGFRIVEQSSQEKAKQWVGALSNNIAWTYHDMGEFETALTYFERGRDYRAIEKKEPGYRIAKWAVARCKRSMGFFQVALDEQKAIEREYFPEYVPGGENVDGYLAEEIGECLLALGLGEDSRPYFLSAANLLGQDPWLSANEPTRIERLRKLSV